MSWSWVTRADFARLYNVHIKGCNDALCTQSRFLASFAVLVFDLTLS